VLLQRHQPLPLPPRRRGEKLAGRGGP
jgi:hypothetical protein